MGFNSGFKGLNRNCVTCVEVRLWCKLIAVHSSHLLKHLKYYIIYRQSVTYTCVTARGIVIVWGNLQPVHNFML